MKGHAFISTGNFGFFLKFCVENGSGQGHNRWRSRGLEESVEGGWKGEFVNNNVRFLNTEPEQNAAGIPLELEELGNLISGLDVPAKAELDSAFQKIVESVRRRHRILVLVQESLSQLRLDIKYLMFDLEATRKERDELKQQLGGF